MSPLRVIPPAEFRGEVEAASLGRALEESATLVRAWRDLLDDEAYIAFVAIFGRWFDRERGRVHYAAGKDRAAA